jgi:mono/diheme cytochrome c family protein
LAVESRSVYGKSSPSKQSAIASALVAVALLILPFVCKLDGKPQADWEQFVGRFHPLIVHLPIGLILLVPLLEIAGRWRPALREAAEFVLVLSAFSCLGAVTLGYLLAYGSGETGAVVVRHMWGGISLTIGVCCCLVVRPWWTSHNMHGLLRGIYPCLLLCVIAALAWTAHEGGSLTHGANYLTEYLPSSLRRWPIVGATATQAYVSVMPDAFYTRHIHPILDSNCVACHGEGKAKGGLRLDSYAQLMKGGQDSAVVVARQPEKSILLQRITLPTDHKNFMPAGGKPPLKPEQIAWIRAWIQQGASPTVASLVGIAVPEDVKEQALPQVEDYSSKMAEMEKTAKEEGVMLTPVSNNLKNGLILNTANATPKFGDAQLAKFEKYAPYIVEAELGRTVVTDACFDTLAKFRHLRALHLEGTPVTGVGLAKLSGLTQMTYLNLSETKVTSATISTLGTMKNLKHVYLYDTPAQPIVGQPVAQAAETKTQ